MTRSLRYLGLLVMLISAVPSRAEDAVLKVTAKKFEFTPSMIKLKVGVPVVLELSSLDRVHGFAVPDLKIDEEITPGKPLRVRIVPDRAGTFPFHCSIFCGSGHEGMSGEIVVER